MSKLDTIIVKIRVDRGGMWKRGQRVGDLSPPDMVGIKNLEVLKTDGLNYKCKYITKLFTYFK